jgi:hypothetical protein
VNESAWPSLAQDDQPLYLKRACPSLASLNARIGHVSLDGCA